MMMERLWVVVSNPPSECPHVTSIKDAHGVLLSVGELMRCQEKCLG